MRTSLLIQQHHTAQVCQSHHKPVQCHLTFSSSDDETTLPVNNSSPPSEGPLQKLHSKYSLPVIDDLDDDEEEEDFQTVSLEDDYGRNSRQTFMYT